MEADHRKTINKQKLHKICKIICVVAMINFVVFVIIALLIGGDAINGNETAGHYYLSNKGKLTEVNYYVFTYSKIHTISLFITHPLAIIASIVYSVTGGKRENLWKPKSIL